MQYVYKSYITTVFWLFWALVGSMRLWLCLSLRLYPGPPFAILSLQPEIKMISSIDSGSEEVDLV